MEDEAVLGFLQAAGSWRRAHLPPSAPARLLLGAAGLLLKGRRATTHWASLELLPYFGAIPVDGRVVLDGDWIFAAGVTSGIDGALTSRRASCAGEDAAKAIQPLHGLRAGTAVRQRHARHRAAGHPGAGPPRRRRHDAAPRGHRAPHRCAPGDRRAGGRLTCPANGACRRTATGCDRGRSRRSHTAVLRRDAARGPAERRSEASVVMPEDVGGDDDTIEAAMLALVAARGADKTICPSEIARHLGGPSADPRARRTHRSPRDLLGAGQAGRATVGDHDGGAGQSCSRPRWAPGTAAHPAVSTGCGRSPSDTPSRSLAAERPDIRVAHGSGSAELPIVAIARKPPGDR